MRHAKTAERPLRNPEVVLNLWAYAGADGYVLRLAGKAYVMDGKDEDKLALLRQLSATDFFSAAWQKVPANFSMTNSDGEVMKGIAHASMLTLTRTQVPPLGRSIFHLSKPALHYGYGTSQRFLVIAGPQRAVLQDTTFRFFADVKVRTLQRLKKACK